MKNQLIENVKKHLIKEYNCHSIILYGSFADDTYTDESDIDVICFVDGTDSKNDNVIIDGYKLDAWIKDTSMMKDYSELLHTNDGLIILDERNLCTEMMKGIKSYFLKGPEKLSSEEICFQKNWMIKMMDRSAKGDIEGNYRYHWLLRDSLEIYFGIKSLWYLGPKKSLTWLKNNDAAAYNVFEDALKINASFDKLERLIRFIVEA